MLRDAHKLFDGQIVWKYFFGGYFHILPYIEQLGFLVTWRIDLCWFEWFILWSPWLYSEIGSFYLFIFSFLAFNRRNSYTHSFLAKCRIFGKWFIFLRQFNSQNIPELCLQSYQSEVCDFSGEDRSWLLTPERWAPQFQDDPQWNKRAGLFTIIRVHNFRFTFLWTTERELATFELVSKFINPFRSDGRYSDCKRALYC